MVTTWYQRVIPCVVVKICLKRKHTELASLPDVLPEWGGGGRCAEPEPFVLGRSAPSATSHGERTFG